MGYRFTLLLLAFNACHALYNDAKPVISNVDRLACIKPHHERMSAGV